MPMRAPRCLRIGGDRQHRLRRRPEQQVVDHRLVLEGDVGDLGRQREDDVEVADRQQVGLALGEPVRRRRALALGAVPVAAAVVGDAAVAAVLAGLDVAAERRGAAGLDRRHDLELAEAQVPGMGRAPGGAVRRGRCRRPRARARTGSAVGRRSLPSLSSAELVERARHGADRVGRDPGVERGGVELGVPEQDLDDADVDVRAPADGWRSCGAACAASTRLVISAASRRGMDGAVELAGGDRLDRVAGPGTASRCGSITPAPPALPPPGAQQLEQLRREHGVAILARPCPARPGSACARCRCRRP